MTRKKNQLFSDHSVSKICKYSQPKGVLFLSPVRAVRTDSNELIGNSNRAGPPHPVINNITCTCFLKPLRAITRVGYLKTYALNDCR